MSYLNDREVSQVNGSASVNVKAATLAADRTIRTLQACLELVIIEQIHISVIFAVAQRDFEPEAAGKFKSIAGHGAGVGLSDCAGELELSACGMHHTTAVNGMPC
jgi:hypothetical protein